MTALLVLAALLPTASATPMSITLDSGGTVRGELAWYEYGGDCQISVTEGELMGSILVVPCDRLSRIERLATPVAAAPEAALPVVEAPAVAAVPEATASVAAAPESPEAAPEVVEAPEAAVAAFTPVAPTAMQEEAPEAAPAVAPTLPSLESVAGLALPTEQDDYTVPPNAGEGVPLDGRVTVDPALIGERPEARVPSPARAPTPRVPTSPPAATVGW